MTITLWTDFHLASTVEIFSEFFVSFSSTITRKMFFSLGYTATVFSAQQHQQHMQHNATPSSLSRWDVRLSFGHRIPHRDVGRPEDSQVCPLFPSPPTTTHTPPPDQPPTQHLPPLPYYDRDSRRKWWWWREDNNEDNHQDGDQGQDRTNVLMNWCRGKWQEDDNMEDHAATAQATTTTTAGPPTPAMSIHCSLQMSNKFVVFGKHSDDRYCHQAG
jgi:hypothetical protein